MSRNFVRALALLLVLAGCSESHSHPNPGDTATNVIGAEGGTVQLPRGARVAIPAGALAEPTSITITVLNADAVQGIPGNLEAVGATYAFLPHGTTFSQPVTIELPFAGSDAGLRAQRLDDEQDTTWEPMLGGTTRNGVLFVESRTFSVVTPTRPRTWNGMDAGLLDASAEPTVKWTATKTALDVWWSAEVSSPLYDPGRDTLEIYTLTKTTGVCDDEASETVVKVCGINLPTYTSDVMCEAYQLAIPESAWESPSMPSFAAQTNSTGDADGGAVAAKIATAVLGIDLDHDAAWPTLEMTAPLSCRGGSGADCYPDHDGDGLPGITASIAGDPAEYYGPYDDGMCTTGFPYRTWSLPTDAGVNAGGGPGRSVRVVDVHLGLRTKFAVDACEQGGSIDPAYRVESSAVGCVVDPTTLNPYGLFGPDPRIASMDYTCTADEAQFVNRFLPQFRVLGRGERPGEVRRPNGWIWNGRDRDIDRRVSEGTRVDTVTLDDDTDGGSQPTCAQVRATFR